MARGKRLERAARRLAVVLHEDEVPQLKHVRVVLVHQRRRVAPADQVVVQLRARAARSGLAHLPEVVLGAAGQHLRRRQHAQPQIPRLLVRRQAERLVARKVGRVEPRALEAILLREQLMRPQDRLLLEVVAEAPAAEHLEEGVVIRVHADVLEVVVLAARADAPLRVGGAGQPRHRIVWVALPEEGRLELVHAGVAEEQRRVVVRHHGR